MSKLFRLAVSLLPISFLLAGCNSGGGTSSTSTSTSTGTITDTDTGSVDPDPDPEPDPAPTISTVSKVIPSFIVISQYYPQYNILLPTYNIQGKEDIPYIHFEDLCAAMEFEDYHLTVNVAKKKKCIYTFTYSSNQLSSSFEVNLNEDTIKFTKDQLGDYGFFTRINTNENGTKYFINGADTNHCLINNSLSKIHVTKKLPTYDLGKYGLDIVIDHAGSIYFPFNVLNDIFILPLYYTLGFNGENYFVLLEGDAWNIDETTGFINYYFNCGNKNKATRTQALATYTYNEFLFFMENIYGLHSARNYTNLDALIKAEENPIYEALNSTTTYLYEQAMAYVVGKYMFDGHAQYIYPSPYQVQYYDSLGQLSSDTAATENELYNFVTVGNQLAEARYAAGKSDDEGNLTETDFCEIQGDTAIIRFDKFVKSGSLINVYTNSYSYLHENDTPSLFLKAATEIYADSNVENIIVDISVNGGGAIDAMPWLEAFFTEDPSFTTMIDRTGEVIEVHYKVDLNYDGFYNQDDVLFRPYNCYLLTSGHSFSCGNGLPTVVKERGLMTIIGQKSGGGECAVTQYSSGTGNVLRNSSMYHMGYYDQTTHKFVGNNGGIEPDYELDYEYFYDTDALIDFIHDLQS